MPPIAPGSPSAPRSPLHMKNVLATRRRRPCRCHCGPPRLRRVFRPPRNPSPPGRLEFAESHSRRFPRRRGGARGHPPRLQRGLLVFAPRSSGAARISVRSPRIWRARWSTWSAITPRRSGCSRCSSCIAPVCGPAWMLKGFRCGSISRIERDGLPNSSTKVELGLITASRARTEAERRAIAKQRAALLSR